MLRPVVFVAAVVPGLIWSGAVAIALFQEPEPAPWAASARLDPSKVKGAEACKKCHDVARNSWEQSKHFNSLPLRIKESQNPSSKVTQFADKMGVKFESGTCLTCHATTQAKDGGAPIAISGISCESCHGASGGQDGWFDIHSNKNEKARFLTESEADQAKRFAADEKAGMIRPHDTYTLARNCFGCHIVHNEKLVNVAGHPSGSKSFDLASWVAGEVRHNFQADPKVNALSSTALAHYYGVQPPARSRVLYVVGLMVELEFSLRNLARATPGETYSRDLASRCRSVSRSLGKVPVPEAEQAGAAYDGVRRLLRKGKDEADKLNAAAQTIATAAKAFAKNNDGTKLGALDETIGQTPPKGAVFDPK